MSAGLQLISAAIAVSSASALIGMPPEMFLDGELEAFNFVRGHHRQYRELPETRTVQEATGVRLPAAPEAIAFYIDRVYERHEYNQIRERFAGLREGLSTMDMPAVSSAVHDMYRVTRQRSRRGLEAVNLREAGELVLNRLNATRGYGGITGIETGWPTYDITTGGYQPGDLISFVGRPELGKCMDPDTEVVMAHGGLKRIGDLKVGDLLMGPDSTPRRVLSTTTGTDPMYRVIGAGGDPFVCNGAHILVMRCAADCNVSFRKGSEHLLSVDQYLSLSPRVQRKLRLVRSAIELPAREVEVSPYYLGVWLGDGCRANGRIATVDKEIVDAVCEEAARFGLSVSQYEKREGFCPSYGIVGTKGKDHVVLDFFRSQCVKNGEKRIPLSYLHNSSDVRRQVLAGLIDTDGYLHESGLGFEFTTKWEGLRDDFLYLCRSLGLRCTVGVKIVNGARYQRVYVTGDIWGVPTRLARKQAPRLARRNPVEEASFVVESLGVGDYAGITLDKDHLYLLRDFTVTHNTYLILRQAWKAHEAGANVLFVTTEMPAEQIGRRHLAIALGINPYHLKNNTLSTHTERRVREFYRSVSGAERFHVFSVGMGSTVASVEAFIQELDPDLVVIDGVYLLRSTQAGKNASRTERITAVFDEIKALTLETNKPFLVSTQLNRMAGKGGAEGSLENIGFTDAVGTHSSIVVGMRFGPTTNPRASRWLQFLKGREGEQGKIAINFKFSPLDMNEFTPDGEDPDADATQNPAVRANVDWMA